MMVSTENGIRIGRNKTNANFMEVSLNGLTSTMLPSSDKDGDEVSQDIRQCFLSSIFESHTGMYTTL